jgi:phosphoglycerate dehydrogenase-like enzyme
LSLVLITDFMGDNTALEEELFADANIDVVVSAGLDHEYWANTATRADAILTRHARVDAETIECLEQCRIIARYGTGHDNVDVDAAVARGIAVTNVPGYCTEEVADHALALLLAAARHIPAYADSVRTGAWTPSPLPPVRRLRGRRLALYGCGRIGAAVAERARAFGLAVFAYDPHESKLPAGITRALTTDDLVDGADILSLHAPLTPTTRQAIGARELAALAPGAIVVNVARGQLLDIRAALGALETGQLAALALDVLDAEPPARDHPIRRHAGVLMTPHVAYYSTASVAEAKRRSVAEVIAVIRGEAPRHPVAVAGATS